MGYKFSVITLSEIWTSENKSVSIKYGTIPRYHLYHGINGKTLKGRCGFHIRKNIQYKPRNDLDIYYHKNNGFQSCWTEILNDQKPNIIIDAHYRHPQKKSDTTLMNRLKDN